MFIGLYIVFKTDCKMLEQKGLPSLRYSIHVNKKKKKYGQL